MHAKIKRYHFEVVLLIIEFGMDELKHAS